MYNGTGWRSYFFIPQIMSKRHNRVSATTCDRLPDELLVSILSFLTLKEAAATSILSRRWRHLWVFTTNLDFDGTDFFLRFWSDKPSLTRERDKYVAWVDDVVAKLQGVSPIRELRILFTLTNSHKESIDAWVRYALSRKLEKLELNLTNIGCDYTLRGCYTFPCELLKCAPRDDFTRLRRIFMQHVNLKSEALEFFLRNCPQLEYFSVNQSWGLTDVKVIGPLPKLKGLEIFCAYGLGSFEIRDAAGLSYLKYYGRRTRHFVIKNVPMLVELEIGGTLADSMEDVLKRFWSCLPRLEIFRIHRLNLFHQSETGMFHSRVKTRMSNLKHLVVKSRGFDWEYGFNINLLPITNLLLAAPFLQSFVLEMSHQGARIENKTITTNRLVLSYPHLERVEFVGFRGSTSEVEFVAHFLENVLAPLLKEVIIDTRQRGGSHAWSLCDYKLRGGVIEEEMKAARACANKLLLKRVPSRINFRIV